MSFHNLAEPAIYLVVLTMKEALFAANCSTVIVKKRTAVVMDVARPKFREGQKF